MSVMEILNAIGMTCSSIYELDKNIYFLNNVTFLKPFGKFSQMHYLQIVLNTDKQTLMNVNSITANPDGTAYSITQGYRVDGVVTFPNIVSYDV